MSETLKTEEEACYEEVIAEEGIEAFMENVAKVATVAALILSAYEDSREHWVVRELLSMSMICNPQLTVALMENVVEILEDGNV